MWETAGATPTRTAPSAPPYPRPHRPTATPMSRATTKPTGNRPAGDHPAGTGPAEDTRAALVAAAEALFAARGVEGVSLREINRVAGQRNSSALQYHFGDRAGLVRAVVAKHHRGVDAGRHLLLDAYQAEGHPELRPLAAALVMPLAAKLADRDGGRSYLQLVAELVNRPEPVLDPAAMADPRDSIYRWRTLVEPLLPEGTSRTFHPRFVAIRFTHVELGRRAADRPRRDDRLFVSRLVDLVVALLATPLSDPTRRLWQERRR